MCVIYLTLPTTVPARLLRWQTVNLFSSSPSLNTWRAFLSVTMVFMMLATTGWTAVQHPRGPGEPLPAALAAWKHGRLGTRTLPSPDAPPKRLAAFFASLTAAQRTRLVSRYPLVVGNLNGAPLTLRYRANRRALAQQRGVEQRRMHDNRLSPDGRQQAGRRMERYVSLLRDGRQILAFDPSGKGRAAEVFGDLATARRVSVVVPGVDTNVLSFEKTGEHEFAAPAGMGASLYAAQQMASPRTPSAVIAWADYTSPAGLGIDAATGTLAKGGAVRLSAMIAGLPGSARVSLMCHSYGSVVCGIAAPHLPHRVSDVAVAGSPGMRVRNAAQLHTDAHVWAMRDAGDWVRDIPNMVVVGIGHGADPVGDHFGSRVVSAAGADGHSGYFTPGTESLSNFADIGVGAYRAVSCAASDLNCHNGISGAQDPSA
jgi:hypothetical protein